MGPHGWGSLAWASMYVSQEDSLRGVTQDFDTKQAGRRIFEIGVYRPGNFDEHAMTPRQDGGFVAALKMSQLGTSQDLWTRDFLWAATRGEKIGRRVRGRARIFTPAAIRNEKKQIRSVNLRLAKIFNGRDGRK